MGCVYCKKYFDVTLYSCYICGCCICEKHGYVVYGDTLTAFRDDDTSTFYVCEKCYEYYEKHKK
jgi:hypothetical protein